MQLGERPAATWGPMFSRITAGGSEYTRRQVLNSWIAWVRPRAAAPM